MSRPRVQELLNVLQSKRSNGKSALSKVRANFKYLQEYSFVMTAQTCSRAFRMTSHRSHVPGALGRALFRTNGVPMKRLTDHGLAICNDTNMIGELLLNVEIYYRGLYVF